jgi:hypothetical protein
MKHAPPQRGTHHLQKKPQYRIPGLSRTWGRNLNGGSTALRIGLRSRPLYQTAHSECAAGDDPVNVSVALQIVLQAERVPYETKAVSGSDS